MEADTMPKSDCEKKKQIALVTSVLYTINKSVSAKFGILLCLWLYADKVAIFILARGDKRTICLN